MPIVSRRQSGLTLLELMIVFAIIGVLVALGAPESMRYLVRAKAARVIADARPIVQAIQEYQGTIDRSRYRLKLVNGADGSISGCQAPAEATCDATGATPVVIVKPEQLLITDSSIRVSAAPCYVDCPGFALNFSSDVNLVSASPTSPTTPATPATSADTTPGASVKDQGKGAGKGKQGALDEWPGWRVLSGLNVFLVPSAHAAGPAAAATGSTTQTNQVLYEFGELMRRKAYAADNAACLLGADTCTVTIKY